MGRDMYIHMHMHESLSSCSRENNNLSVLAYYAILVCHAIKVFFYEQADILNIKKLSESSV